METLQTPHILLPQDYLIITELVYIKASIAFWNNNYKN